MVFSAVLVTVRKHKYMCRISIGVDNSSGRKLNQLVNINNKITHILWPLAHIELPPGIMGDSMMLMAHFFLRDLLTWTFCFSNRFVGDVRQQLGIVDNSFSIKRVWKI